jgi:DNA-binding MarR family transcriptional regulator
VTQGRAAPENLAILLRERLRAMNAELIERLAEQAMAQLVEHLEARGYVERIPDPDDRRAKLVRATDLGRDVYAVVRAYVADVEARLERELGAAKLRRLRALLEELGALWR